MVSAKSVRKSQHRSSTKKHTASVDSIDYDLSSSDDENNKKDYGEDAIDIREEMLVVTIARDRNHGGDVSPARTDISDAKTSDITKKSHARDVSGIMHEKAASNSVSASQRLETRSDNLSQAVSVVQDESIRDRTDDEPLADEPEVLRQSLQVDDVSFASSSHLDYSIKNLDMASILKHRQGHHVSFQNSYKNQN